MILFITLLDNWLILPICRKILKFYWPVIFFGFKDGRPMGLLRRMIDVNDLIKCAHDLPALLTRYWLVFIPLILSFVSMLLFGGEYDDKWYKKLKKPM